MPAFQPLVVVCSFAFTVTIVEKCFVFIPYDTFTWQINCISSNRINLFMSGRRKRRGDAMRCGRYISNGFIR